MVNFLISFFANSQINFLLHWSRSCLSTYNNYHVIHYFITWIEYLQFDRAWCLFSFSFHCSMNSNNSHNLSHSSLEGKDSNNCWHNNLCYLLDLIQIPTQKQDKIRYSIEKCSFFTTPNATPGLRGLNKRLRKGPLLLCGKDWDTDKNKRNAIIFKIFFFFIGITSWSTLNTTLMVVCTSLKSNLESYWFQRLVFINKWEGC